MKLFLYLIIVSHICLVFANIFAFFALPFLAPWYVAVPLWSFLINLMFNRHWTCPLTDLENSIRRKLGMKEVHKFIAFYFKRPIYKFLGIQRKRKVVKQIDEYESIVI